MGFAIKNREVFDKDIDTFSLENQGVAKVDEALDDQQLQTLRFELETFVCNGRYAKEMERVLDAFLKNLANAAEQPGVWISGFYGSGKSHLAKMLRTPGPTWNFRMVRQPVKSPACRTMCATS